MRLVRLKLRGCTFWNLPPVQLSYDNRLSQLLNVDLLTEKQKEIINKSISNSEISLVDKEGNSIEGTIEDIKVIEGNYVSNDDIEDDLNALPEIVSVTVEEEEEEEEEVNEGPPEEVLEKAEVILKRNGNTAKKIILALPKTEENLMLLHACISLESKGKQRKGLLQAIYSSISEY